ncbi:MAG: hypothetical protein GF335_02160 [Candidatus Moranbacteria bacterium]|nr:hypothetical protein [Candidatus Moranbacteria bacterium]
MSFKKFFFDFSKPNRLILAVILILTLILILFSFGNQNDRPQVLKIGFITDAHCRGDFNDSGNWELKKECQKPLLSFVENMNQQFNPDVILDGGDLIEGNQDFEESKKTWIKASGILNKIKAPVFFVLGNHELDKFTKKQWLDLTDQENPYYFFDKNGYRIIVLDGNFLKLKNQEIDINPSNKFYPGYVNSSQIKWLKEILQDSQNYQKVVFIHQPPIKKTTVKNRSQLLLNYEELNRLFEKHQVLAVFSGHIEEFCHIQNKGVEYFSLQGFVKGQKLLNPKDRFENQGLFYQIVLKDGEAKVKAYFKKDPALGYESFEINQNTVICNNHSLSLKQHKQPASNWQKIKNMVLND